MSETIAEPLIEEPLVEQPSLTDVLGMWQGKPITHLPKDLFIPPEAMEVFLETFSGPLDLLLYLIKRNNLDIIDIPIAAITTQYMQYVELMKNCHLELAAEYLVMAATLAEIKSRMLLPRQTEEEDEDDPRAELVRRLQEYERFKHAAVNLEEMPRLERDFFEAHAELPNLKITRPLPEVVLEEVLRAFKDILKRADATQHHKIKAEPLSVRERMTGILNRIQNHKDFTEFTSFFNIKEGRQGVVVTLIAVLELLKETLIEIVQAEAYAPIYLRAISHGN